MLGGGGRAYVLEDAPPAAAKLSSSSPLPPPAVIVGACCCCRLLLSALLSFLLLFNTPNLQLVNVEFVPPMTKLNTKSEKANVLHPNPATPASHASLSTSITTLNLDPPSTSVSLLLAQFFHSSHAATSAGGKGTERQLSS